MARLEGKSSLGRLGLLIHSTAGYVDPGWKGKLTLELSNVAKLPIALYFGMKIGQISFFEMSSPVDRPYGSAGLGSKYQGQSEPTASAYFEDFGPGWRGAGARAADHAAPARSAPGGGSAPPAGNERPARSAGTGAHSPLAGDEGRGQ